MCKEFNSAQILLRSSATFAWILVLFSDVFGAPLGGYADKRFAIAIISGVLIATFFFAYPKSCPVSLGLVAKVLSPTLFLSLAFLFLAFPFWEQSYVWVEPGMYALYFMASIVGGVWLAWSNGGNGYLRFLLLLTAASCTLYGLASVNVYLFATFDGVTKLVDFIPWGFVNIRYWSHIASWSLPLFPLAVLVGPLKDVRIWRAFVLLGAGMWWWIVLITTARGSVLSIVFGVVFVMLLFGRRALPWVRVFLRYLIVGIAIWFLLSVVVPSFMDSGVQVRSVKADTSGRIPLFVEAWQMSLQNFPFGEGPQSWLTHDPITEDYAQSKKFGHPHNMYLMWAAEYGWFLIFAMGLVVIQAIRYFWKRRIEAIQSENPEYLLLLAGFTASVSAALFHAGASAVFMAPGSMLVGLFVLIGFWALVLPSVSSRGEVQLASKSSQHRMGVSRILAVAFIVLWVLWLGEVWRYYQNMRLDESYYFEHENEGMLPRFWFHGNYPRD